MQEPPDDPVSEARDAIWGLFEAGLIDEHHATTALLAISTGVHRMQEAAAEHNAGASEADPRV
jgi:hypothetical protein